MAEDNGISRLYMDKADDALVGLQIMLHIVKNPKSIDSLRESLKLATESGYFTDESFFDFLEAGETLINEMVNSFLMLGGKKIDMTLFKEPADDEPGDDNINRRL